MWAGTKRRGGPTDGFLVKLVILAVISTAFNDLYPVLPIGELSKDGFVYLFLALTGYLLVFHFPRLELPPPLVVLTLVFLAVVVVGVTTNYPEIASAYFKGRSGMSRVVTQGIAIVFGLMVTAVFYNLTVRGYFAAIADGAFWAIVVMAVVGFFEFASWFSLPGLTTIHGVISAVVHENADYVQRLRMTAFEVSWASVVLTFLFPFALASPRIRGWRIGALTALVILLVLLTQSRTALFVAGFQVMVVAVIYLRGRIHTAIYALFGGCVFALLLLLTPGVSERVGEAITNVVEHGNIGGSLNDTEENLSNVTRLAGIRAGFEMFSENVLTGVGLGQYGFNYPAHIRAEDLRSWEVQYYITSSEEGWPPSYSLHARLLAEMGLAGYLTWLAVVLVVLGRSLRRSGLDTLLGRAHLAVAITMAGWLLLGFSIDTFRFFGGWIAIGIGFGLARFETSTGPVRPPPMPRPIQGRGGSPTAALALALGCALWPGDRVAMAEDAHATAGTPVLGMSTPFGVLRDRSDLELIEEFAAYRALGITWLRTDLYWADVQQAGPESYDWTGFDRVLGHAQRAGLTVLPVIGTVPTWARVDSERRSPPADPASYAAFAGEAAERYGPMGIDTWEIWNEPNISQAFPPAPDPDLYAEMLKLSHAAIKDARPEATVILGGLSPVQETEDAPEPDHFGAADFLERVYDAGGGRAFDVLGYHAYSYPNLPEEEASWNGWTILEADIGPILEAQGDPVPPIWVTEFGMPTNGTDQAEKEAQQARMLEQGLDLIGAKEGAGPLFLYTYRDRGEDPDDKEDWFGFLRPDGSEKPAARRLKDRATGTER